MWQEMMWSARKIPLSLQCLPNSGFIAGVMVKQNCEELERGEWTLKVLFRSSFQASGKLEGSVDGFL